MALQRIQFTLSQNREGSFKKKNQDTIESSYREITYGYRRECKCYQHGDRRRLKKKKSRGSPGVLTDRETKLWLTEMTVLRHLLKV